MTVAVAISSIASKSCSALASGNREEEEFEARTVDSMRADVVSLVMEVLRVAVSVTVDVVVCTFVNVMLATFVVVEDFGFEEFVAGI